MPPPGEPPNSPNEEVYADLIETPDATSREKARLLEDAQQSKRRLETHRFETNKWILGIVATIAGAMLFVAGRMTSHWLDLNAELRELRERIAVMEVTASVPQLPDSKVVPSNHPVAAPAAPTPTLTSP